MEDEQPRDLLSRSLLSIGALFLALAVAVRPMVSGLTEGLVMNLVIATFIIIGGAVLLLRAILIGRLRCRRTGLELPLAAFLMVSLTSALLATHKMPAFEALFDWVCMVILFYAVLHLCETDDRIRLLRRVLVASAVVVALNGIWQYFVGLEELRQQLLADPDGMLAMLGLPREFLGDLIARTEHRRVFSTFVQPNSLAGFLILMIPLELGHLLDQLAARRRARGLIAPIIVIALLGMCLALTMSKGGIIACAVAVLVLAIRASGSVLRRVRRPLIVGLIVLAAAGLVAAGLRSSLRKAAVESMDVRRGYWEAGVEMIRDHFWIGVGPNVFADYYPRYKGPTAGETLKAHNNYIQLWAEIGVLGFAAFCLIWAVWLRQNWRACAVEQEAPSETALSPLLIGMVGFIAGVVVFAILRMTGLPWATSTASVAAGLTLVFLVAWLVTFGSSRGGESLDWTRQGIVAGVVAFLVHSLVDFDWYVHGVSQTLWVLAAMAFAIGSLRAKRRLVFDVTLKPVVQIVAACVCIGVLLVLFLGIPLVPASAVLPRVMESAIVTESAKAELTAMRTGPTQVDRGYFSGAVRKYQRAIELNRWNDAALLGLSETYTKIWQTPVGRPDDQLFTSAEQALLDTIALNPTSAQLHYRLGMLYEEAVRSSRPHLLRGALATYRELLAREAAGNRYFIPAYAKYRDAAWHYPTNARYRMKVGIMLARLGLGGRARQELSDALRLDELAPDPHMKLKPGDVGDIERELRALTEPGLQSP